MAHLNVFPVSIIVAAFLLACSSTPGPPDEEREKEKSADSYKITIGSGGGVTGNVTGIRIETDGKVTEWSALANQEAKPEFLGTMPQNRLNVLYTIIEEDSLMFFDHAETGNMTSFLTLKGAGDLHRIRWAGIETDTVVAPHPLRRFIDALNKSYKLIEKP